MLRLGATVSQENTHYRQFSTTCIDKPLHFVVEGLQSIAGNNAICGVYLLSKNACPTDSPLSSVWTLQVSMMYSTVMQHFQSVAIHMAVSAVSRGKSNCAKLAIAAVGNFTSGYMVHLTKSTSRSYLCLLYTSPSPRDATLPRMPSSA